MSGELDAGLLAQVPFASAAELHIIVPSLPVGLAALFATASMCLGTGNDNCRELALQNEGLFGNRLIRKGPSVMTKAGGLEKGLPGRPISAAAGDDTMGPPAKG